MMDYPNSARFQQLAIDNTETEWQLKQLDLQYKAEQVAYHSKVSALEKHRAELYEHSQRSGLSAYEEGRRREKIRVLTARIAEFEKPQPVNEEIYRIQRQMLEHKLREITHLNTTILIWEAQKNRN